MVQASCRKCGVTMQFEDDEVPPSGKVVKCTGCKSPVTVMPREAAAMGLPVSSASPGEDVLELDDLLQEPVDLGAVPSPARPSPLAGVKPPPKVPTPAIGLAAATPGAKPAAPKSSAIGLGDLPAVAKTDPNPLGDLPAPRSPFAEPRKNIGADDLVAPKARPARPVPPRPSPPSDLPAPRAAGALGDLPAPRASSDSDLPAPRAPSDSDLPAPKATGGLDLPAPKATGGLDLPAPKAPGGLDLPTPKAAGGLGDLPVPAGAKAAVGDLPGPAAPGLGLPTPRTPDLPRPKTDQLADLLMPSSAGDLPAPSPGIDLPAPKGAAGGGVDLGAAGRAAGKAAPDIELPAPLPAGSLSLDEIGLDPGGSSPSSGGLSLDDIDLSPPGGGGGGIGLGDGEPLELGGSGSGGGGGLGLDIGEPLELGGGGGIGGLELGDSFELGGGGSGGGIGLSGASAGGEPLSLDGLELEAPSSSAGLELDMPSAGSKKKASSDFDGLELPDVSAHGPASKKDSAGVSFSKPSAKAAEKAAKAKSSKSKKKKDTGPLELDIDPHAAGARAPLPSLAPAPMARREAAEAAAGGEEKSKASRKKKLVIAAAVIGVLGVGGGGFFGFTKWQEKNEREANLKARIDAADKNLRDGKWGAAQKEAGAALQVDANDTTALALAMQAHFAPVIDNGSDGDKALQTASDWTRKLQTGTGKGPEVDKAQGLRLLVEGRAKQAAKQLKGVTTQAPQDANAYLFLGWALAADYDLAEAEKVFGKALKRTPKRVSVLYGLARTQLSLGKNKEAQQTLSTLIDIDKSHVGAQVALAEMAEVSRFGEREKRFLEILARGDLDKADPREVSRAWALAGGEALLAGRVGEAQDRFSKALKLRPDNLDAVVGQARSELAEGRLDNAFAKVKKVLGLDKSHLDAQLTLAEIHLAKAELDEALTAVEAVLGRKNPVQNRAALTRAHMVRGQILATDPQTHAEAEEDFKAAIDSKLDGDIAPLVALSQLYNADGRGQEAVELLKPVEEAARKDSALAVTLGVAYLGANKAELAETWFRTALETRPDDIEAKFQLGLAQAGQQKYDESIATLEEAYKSSGGREDVGIRLATMYASMGKQSEAYKYFEEMLAKEDPSVNLRSQAGRFFAKIGDTDRASQMGDSILAEQPQNPAGLYLKGEALMAAHKYKEARDLFSDASGSDPQPQFFEGLGRANEGLGELNPALKAYSRALEGDPRYLVARLARARLFVAQRRFGKALEELDKAEEVDPNNAQIEFFRGKTFVSLKKHDDAVKHLAKSLRLDSRPAETHYYIGVAYYNRDKAREAAAALSAATHRARGDEEWLVEAYRVLGYAQRAAGNNSGAAAAWRNFLDRADKGSKSVDEVKRLLMRIEAR